MYLLNCTWVTSLFRKITTTRLLFQDATSQQNWTFNWFNQISWNYSEPKLLLIGVYEIRNNLSGRQDSKQHLAERKLISSCFKALGGAVVLIEDLFEIIIVARIPDLAKQINLLVQAENQTVWWRFLKIKIFLHCFQKNVSETYFSTTSVVFAYFIPQHILHLF